MPAGGADLAGLLTVGMTIAPQSATSTVTGSSVDFRDCGPEVSCAEMIGINPGDDTTMDTKVQHSYDDSTWADIIGATFTQVVGDTENVIATRTFYNRARRYCRAIMTVTGSSPTALVCVILACRKTSF